MKEKSKKQSIKREKMVCKAHHLRKMKINENTKLNLILGVIII